MPKKAAKAKVNPESIPRLVPHPVHLSEDEADIIMSMRAVAEGDFISLEDYLAESGYELESPDKRKSKKKPSADSTRRR